MAPPMQRRPPPNISTHLPYQDFKHTAFWCSKSNAFVMRFPPCRLRSQGSPWSVARACSWCLSHPGSRTLIQATVISSSVKQEAERNTLENPVKVSSLLCDQKPEARESFPVHTRNSSLLPGLKPLCVEFSLQTFCLFQLCGSLSFLPRKSISIPEGSWRLCRDNLI